MVTDAEILTTYQRVRSQRQAAQLLGVGRNRVRKVLSRGPQKPQARTQSKLPSWGPLPPSDIPIDEILDHKERAFLAARAHTEARLWMPVRIHEAQPFGVIFFGDTHLDDDGCDIPLLRRHIALARPENGIYGVFMGDAENNWTGRLARLYANQNTGKARAARLVEWFYRDCGIAWLAILAGNHDLWSNNFSLQSLLANSTSYLAEWRAQITLTAANGSSWRLDLAHDYRGHSEWNVVHGLAKAAAMITDADVIVAAHRHTWGISQYELRSRLVTAARCRGYKRLDKYALHNGLPEDRCGASIFMIFDPTQSDPAARTIPFADPETGARVLQAMRNPTRDLDCPKARGRIKISAERSPTKH